MTRLTARAPAAVVLLMAATLGLAACGGDADAASGDDTTGDGSSSADEEEAPSSGDPILDFYQCLRDNGLDVEDPGTGGGIQVNGDIDLNDPETEAIVGRCAETHLGSTDGRVTVGEGEMGENMASTESLIEFVDCMREHGIDMPDPELSRSRLLWLALGVVVATPCPSGFSAAPQRRRSSSEPSPASTRRPEPPGCLRRPHSQPRRDHRRMDAVRPARHPSFDQSLRES